MKTKQELIVAAKWCRKKAAEAQNVTDNATLSAVKCGYAGQRYAYNETARYLERKTRRSK